MGDLRGVASGGEISGTGAEASELTVPLTVSLAWPLSLSLLLFLLPLPFGLWDAAGDGRQSGLLCARWAAL